MKQRFILSFLFMVSLLFLFPIQLFHKTFILSEPSSESGSGS